MLIKMFLLKITELATFCSTADVTRQPALENEVRIKQQGNNEEGR
jgi:hypothetical protein